MNILKILTASFLAVMLSFPVYAGEAKDKVKVGFIYVGQQVTMVGLIDMILVENK